jgi:hypothetical protein
VLTLNGVSFYFGGYKHVPIGHPNSRCCNTILAVKVAI